MNDETTNTPPQAPKLLDLLRERIRLKHYSIRTEQSYVHWAKRYLFFHKMRHPAEMGKVEIEAFLTSLAVEGKVSASTQTQALSALVFLYKEVLGQAFPWLTEVTRAKRTTRLPTVLTQPETRALLSAVDDPLMDLILRLLYGTGMRLMEALRLRVKDVEFSRNEIVVREGKGSKDRVTMLPVSLAERLQSHLAVVKAQHDADLALGRGEVWLPNALAVKYPNAPREWGWQYVFPAAGFSTDPRSGAVRRHHVDDKRVQRAVKSASVKAGIAKQVSPHALRHYSEFRTMPTKAAHAHECEQQWLFPGWMHAGISA
jgi:integron integrase